MKSRTLRARVSGSRSTCARSVPVMCAMPPSTSSRQGGRPGRFSRSLDPLCNDPDSGPNLNATGIKLGPGPARARPLKGLILAAQIRTCRVMAKVKGGGNDQRCRQTDP